MGLKRLTDATSEPISTAEAKAFMRVSASTEDTLIGSLIKAARQACEAYTGRAFITQTWEYNLDQFPSTRAADSDWDGVREGPVSSLFSPLDYIDLPVAPLISVGSLKTYADDGTATTMTATDYIVDVRRVPGRITLARGASWPVDLRTANAVLITFDAGYGAAAAVPGPIVQAIYQATAFFFENREQAGNLPELVRTLLTPYRILKL
jgi:hypothetical protein